MKNNNLANFLAIIAIIVTIYFYVREKTTGIEESIDGAFIAILIVMYYSYLVFFNEELVHLPITFTISHKIYGM